MGMLAPGVRQVSHSRAWENIAATARARFPQEHDRKRWLAQKRRDALDRMRPPRGLSFDLRQRKRFYWLANILKTAHTFGLPLRDILDDVCSKHKLEAGDLRSQRRQRGLILARFEFCYRAFTETDRTLPQIGAVICKDHTSVINAVRKWAKMHGLPLPRGMVQKGAKK